MTLDSLYRVTVLKPGGLPSWGKKYGALLSCPEIKYIVLNKYLNESRLSGVIEVLNSDEHFKMSASALDILLRFLNLPIIVDNFKNPEGRQNWRTYIEKEQPPLFKLYENGALRINHISAALSAFEILGMNEEHLKLGKIFVADYAYGRFSGLQERVKQIWDRRANRSTQDKVEFIENELYPGILYLLDFICNRNLLDYLRALHVLRTFSK